MSQWSNEEGLDYTEAEMLWSVYILNIVRKWCWQDVLMDGWPRCDHWLKEFWLDL